jgi:hypothetical protein
MKTIVILVMMAAVLSAEAPRLFMEPYEVHQAVTTTFGGYTGTSVGSRNVAAEATKAILKRCSEQVTVTTEKDRADYMLVVSNGLLEKNGDVITTKLVWHSVSTRSVQ